MVNLAVKCTVTVGEFDDIEYLNWSQCLSMIFSSFQLMPNIDKYLDISSCVELPEVQTIKM